MIRHGTHFVLAEAPQSPDLCERDYRLRLYENHLPCIIGKQFFESSSSSEDSTDTESNGVPELRGFKRRVPVWKPDSYSKYEPLYPQLHNEIEQYATYTKSVVQKMAVRIEQTILSVRDCVHALWPKASVETFGSYSTGLWLPNSDVDLVVLGVGEPEDQLLQCIQKLALVLKTQSWIESILVVETAKVPVIKVVSSGSGVPIDITFESASTHSGLLSRDLVIEFTKSMPQLYPLAMVIKQLLRERGLNDAYTGGLSSYSAVLMIVHYIQLWSAGPDAFHDASVYASGRVPDIKKPNHTPNESTMRSYASVAAHSRVTKADCCDNFNELVASLKINLESHGRKHTTTNIETTSEASTDSEMGDDLNTHDTSNLGHLLVRLLEFFGTVYDFKLSGISVREGGFIYRLCKEAQEAALVIEDPIYPAHNVGSSSFAMKKVVSCFENAFYALKYFRPSRFSPSPLCCFLTPEGHEVAHHVAPNTDA